LKSNFATAQRCFLGLAHFPSPHPAHILHPWPTHASLCPYPREPTTVASCRCPPPLPRALHQTGPTLSTVCAMPDSPPPVLPLPFFSALAQKPTHMRPSNPSSILPHPNDSLSSKFIVALPYTSDFLVSTPTIEDPPTLSDLGRALPPPLILGERCPSVIFSSISFGPHPPYHLHGAVGPSQYHHPHRHRNITGRSRLHHLTMDRSPW
jgi:hypothetical protein